MEFGNALFWALHKEKPKLVKNQAIYFPVDTVITSQVIFLRLSTGSELTLTRLYVYKGKRPINSWVVTFDSPVTKKAVLELANIEINGVTFFLGDC